MDLSKHPITGFKITSSVLTTKVTTAKKANNPVFIPPLKSRHTMNLCKTLGFHR